MSLCIFCGGLLNGWIRVADNIVLSVNVISLSHTYYIQAKIRQQSVRLACCSLHFISSKSMCEYFSVDKDRELSARLCSLECFKRYRVKSLTWKADAMKGIQRWRVEQSP